MELTKLDFLVPIANVRIKVRIGDINMLFDKYKPNIIPPVISFFQPYDTHLLMCLPEDYEPHLSHECGHAACEIIRCMNMSICDETEELVMYLQDYLITYINENL